MATWRTFKNTDAKRCSKLIKETLARETFENKDFREDVLVQYTEEKLIKISKVIHYYILTNNKELIGMGGIKNSGELKTVYVHPDHQGRGYGKKIMEFLEDKAKKLNIKKVFFLAAHPRIKFYKDLGYKLKPKNKDDNYMEKNLR